ncbi:MAG: TIGR02646 family protein [Sphaerochaeta sp.]|nr:TIGR02646 family protein [Sphaerochaeta sp.]
MKYIKKQAPPLEFISWLNKENEDWHPTYEKLQNPEKEIVRLSLFNEQHGLCCYCEGRIACDRSKVHIEHLYPQSLYPNMTVDYKNLLLSCNGQDIHEQKSPCHCGICKDDHDPNLMISPLDPSCEIRFVCREDGTMDAREESDSKAKNTIDYVGLNASHLKRDREAIFEVVFPLITEFTSTEEIRPFVEAKVNSLVDNCYEPFWSVWNQIKKQYFA